MEDYEQALLTVREVLVDYPKRYKENQEILQTLHKEEIDLLHALELVSFNAYEGYYLASELQKIRRERRKIKDDNEFLDPIVKLVKSNKIKEHDLNQTIGAVRNTVKNQEVRSYRMKVRTEMQNMIDKRGINSCQYSM